jgi:Na+-transporting NADH:ubiquinone oxidoreductase subunit NqrF
MENKIGAGGVSDMHFWMLYNTLHKEIVFGEMDRNIDNIFYHTFLVDQTKEQNWDKEEGVKSLYFENNSCYGIHNDIKVEIKYLHCHGSNKLSIPKIINKSCYTI